MFRKLSLIHISQEEACEGILAGKVKSGDVVVIRNEGPKGGPGMQDYQMCIRDRAWGEFSVHGNGAGHVGVVIPVFRAYVHKHQIAVFAPRCV